MVENGHFDVFQSHNFRHGRAEPTNTFSQERHGNGNVRRINKGYLTLGELNDRER